MEPNTDMQSWLNAQPRVALAHLPTPLEPMDRLSEELGGPRLWVKRDDCTGLASGGNKTRKLEYLLGAALADGVTDIVTFGAVQSNHARQTAAACARLGLACHLMLSRQVRWQHQGYERSANVLMDRLSGASVHIVEPDEAKAFSSGYVDKLEAQGRKVRRIPAGGSNATGALGYAHCALELDAQCATLGLKARTVLHASSSAGTQAGLGYGFARAGSTLTNMGVNVYHPEPAALETNVRHLVEKLEAEHGAHGKPALRFKHGYLGDAYGQPTPAALQAISLAARLEGLYFDPVYSGKALAALIDLVAIGEFADDADVVLLHTGGAAVLPVYDNAF